MAVAVLLPMVELLCCCFSVLFSFITLIHSKRYIFWKMLFILHDKRWKIFSVSSTHDFLRNYGFFMPISNTCQIYPQIDIFSRGIFFFKKEFRLYINKFFNRNTQNPERKKLLGVTNVNVAWVHENVNNFIQPNIFKQTELLMVLKNVLVVFSA